MHITRLNGIYSVCRGICIRAGGCHCAAGVCRPPQALSHGVHCLEFHVGRVSLDREGRRRKAEEGRKEGRKEGRTVLRVSIPNPEAFQGGRGGDCRPCLAGATRMRVVAVLSHSLYFTRFPGTRPPQDATDGQTDRQTNTACPQHSSAPTTTTTKHHLTSPHLPSPPIPFPSLPSPPPQQCSSLTNTGRVPWRHCT